MRIQSAGWPIPCFSAIHCWIWNINFLIKRWIRGGGRWVTWTVAEGPNPHRPEVRGRYPWLSPLPAPPPGPAWPSYSSWGFASWWASPSPPSPSPPSPPRCPRSRRAPFPHTTAENGKKVIKNLKSPTGEEERYESGKSWNKNMGKSIF